MHYFYIKISKMKKQLLFTLLGAVLCGDTFAQNWFPVGKPHFSAGDADYSSIVIGKNDTPFVVYADFSSGGNPTVMKYDGSAWVGVGNPGFSNGLLPTIAAAPDGTLYVVYEEPSGRFNGPATVMKFNGSNWVTVGNPGFTLQDAEQPKIVVDKDGTPYVAYVGIDSSSVAYGLVTVMKYNGTNWVTVGSPGFSNGVAAFTSIAIDAHGVPFVAYDDGANGSKATVMKYNGSSWVNVGSAGFSAGNAGKVDIAIAKDGTPYVVYEDRGLYLGTIFLDGRASVMKYNGSSWVNVGTPGFSAGDHIDYPSIAIDTNGTQYVVYEDVPTPTSDYAPATSMKYDGSTWVTVGNAGFSVEGVTSTSMAIDGSGALYVVYARQEVSSGHATVMKYGTNAGVKTLTNSTTTDIAAFPNPNNGSFTVNLPNGLPAQITVTNIVGQKVKEFATGGDNTIDITLNQPPGVYLMTILINDSKTTRKIVVE